MSLCRVVTSVGSDQCEELQERGMDDADAHNAALDDINYDDRYRSYIKGSSEVQEALRYIEDLLEQGEDVVLVCYENTDEKRCHRTLFFA